MDKVMAVVVSYNRATLLAECISALRNQTRRPDAILVVNNGSTDHTEEWLKTQKDIVFITQKNVGSGGGFNTGIKYAYDNGYSWIWCMDDDGYPKEDALDILLKSEQSQPALLNCAVINKEDRNAFVWKTGKYTLLNEVKEDHIEGICHPFNGTLIHRSIIATAGVPNQHLFLWGDETEYFYRIVKTFKIPVYTITKSIHYHPPTAFSYKIDWDFPNSWKMYFYVRNRYIIHQAKFSNRLLAMMNYACFLAAFAGIILVYQKTDKVKKLNFIFWPVSDAFKNNFSETPSTILYRLKQDNRFVFHRLLLSGFRHRLQTLFSPQPPLSRDTATA